MGERAPGETSFSPRSLSSSGSDLSTGSGTTSRLAREARTSLRRGPSATISRLPLPRRGPSFCPQDPTQTHRRTSSTLPRRVPFLLAEEGCGLDQRRGDQARQRRGDQLGSRGRISPPFAASKHLSHLSALVARARSFADVQSGSSLIHRPHPRSSPTSSLKAHQRYGNFVPKKLSTILHLSNDLCTS